MGQQSYSQPPTFRGAGEAANGGGGGIGGVGSVVGQGETASGNDVVDGLWAREATLRVDFLLQVM